MFADIVSSVMIQTALFSSCILTIPIAIITGAPLWRSFLAAIVIYMIFAFAASI